MKRIGTRRLASSHSFSTRADPARLFTTKTATVPSFEVQELTYPLELVKDHSLDSDPEQLPPTATHLLLLLLPSLLLLSSSLPPQPRRLLQSQLPSLVSQSQLQQLLEFQQVMSHLMTQQSSVPLLLLFPLQLELVELVVQRTMGTMGMESPW